MNELVVFAKHWAPGAVKTRLGATIGDQPAASIYRAFVDCILSRLQSVGDQRNICISPATRETEFTQLIGQRAWTVTHQKDGNLGCRMSLMFQERLAIPGVDRVVLIGSDSPDLPTGYINQAFDALQRHDAVLGPTNDGGYYLIGLSRFAPELFGEQMPWSTPRLWRTTIETLRASSHTFATLPEWSDVDTGEDFKAFGKRLSGDNNTDIDLELLQKRISEIADHRTTEQ